jgi:hypothetical protein
VCEVDLTRGSGEKAIAINAFELRASESFIGLMRGFAWANVEKASLSKL